MLKKFKQKTKNMKAVDQGVKALVFQCGRIKKNERVLIICDSATKNIGKMILMEVKKITDRVKIIINDNINIHGAEPATLVAKEMLAADLIFGMTRFSLAHTKARYLANKKGSRYLSLPNYSLEQLARDSLLVNFEKIAKKNVKIRGLFSRAKEIRITTKKGTDITMIVEGRMANFHPGFCEVPGTMSSPPDIEINIAPLENGSHGKIVVDGSIPHERLGLLEKMVEIEIQKGLIKKIGTDSLGQRRVLKNLLNLETMPRRGVLAEFGIGLNPKAKLCGLMLEDEGCLGTVHFGFGSNFTIGGKNRSDLHLDFIIRQPSVYVDGKLIMNEGILKL